jgi:DNA-directed RNA polymerase subunit RPC12/RpoP
VVPRTPRGVSLIRRDGSLPLDKLEAMNTIDEFRDAVTTHFAWSRKLVWTLIAAGLFVFAGAWLTVQAEVPIGSGQYYAFTGLTVGLIAVLVVAVFVGAWCNEGRAGIDPRLACPRCGSKLQIHSALVIATGNCPHCSWRVLADWLPPPFVEKRDRDLISIFPRQTERSNGRLSVLRMRFRGLAVLVVYVVVTLAMIICALSMTGQESAERLAPLLTFIPLVLCGLSALILNPGPRRDLIYMLFVQLLMGFVAISMAGLALYSARTGETITASLLAVVIIVGVRNSLVFGKRFLIPEPCPDCGRKSLLHAAMQHPGLRTYHDYFWCLNCYERHKRLRSGPWERAWSPCDDRFYWLWNCGRWFRSNLDRIRGKMPGTE